MADQSVFRLEHAWTRLMNQIGVVHTRRIASNKIIVRVFNDAMRRK